MRHRTLLVARYRISEMQNYLTIFYCPKNLTLLLGLGHIRPSHGWISQN